MDRREFLKLSGLGMMTLFLSGCGTILSQGGTSAAAAIGGGKKMKIVVVTGSPHDHGTSFLLADKFIEGLSQPVTTYSALMRLLKIFIPVLAAIIAAWMVIAFIMMQSSKNSCPICSIWT